MFPKEKCGEILEMAKADGRLLARITAEGNLADTYHPELKKLHNKNSDRLSQIVADYGWPKALEVGEKVAKAAWVILQHGIERPEFMRQMLVVFKWDDSLGVDRADVARLEDRILFFEDRPQRYGTNFDWNEAGELVPTPIENPELIGELRKSVGLAPLEDDVVWMQSAREKPPTDWRKKQREFAEWAMKVGWR